MERQTKGARHFAVEHNWWQRMGIACACSYWWVGEMTMIGDWGENLRVTVCVFRSC